MISNLKLKNLLFLVIILFPLFSFSNLPDVEKNYTLTKIGDKVPEFTVTTLDGKSINIRQLEGKVVLINFFASWCGPCMAEMPFLEKEIWQKYNKKDFLVIAIGREHSKEELVKFNEEKGFTFLIAPDIKREIYQKFAIQNIPRNFVINKKGEIIYQETGYSPEEFKNMAAVIEKLL